MQARDVVIIGGGIAGLTAAYHLTKQGTPKSRPFRVTVLEMEDVPGGQARAFKQPTFEPANGGRTVSTPSPIEAEVAAFRSSGQIPTHATVEHGSHVFFNYYETILQLIEELRAVDRHEDPIPGFAQIPGWTILNGFGQRALLKHNTWLPGRLGALPSILEIPWLSLWERFKLAWGAYQITETPYSRFNEFDSMTSFEWATKVGYSKVGALTWNSASLGLTNLFVQEQSGAMFAGKHRLLIDTPNGLAYKLPAGNLSHMFADPMRRRIEALGGTVITKARATEIERRGDLTRVTYRVRAGNDLESEGPEQTLDGRHVILATTPRHAAALVPWCDDPWTTLDKVTDVITLVLGLSGKLFVTDPSELGCSREEWAFSVITDLSAYWPEFQTERFRDKSVVRVEIGHADRLPNGIAIGRDELVRIVFADLVRVYPEVEGMFVEWAALHREDKHLYTKWVHGEFSKRPAKRDVGRGVFLAGDWTSKGTIGMESAANSGIEAANHVLVASGMTPIPYRDIPID